MKDSFMLIKKIKENERLFENHNGIKIVREKTGFLKFIWKSESRRLFENRSLWELNLRIRILENKFERNFGK